MSFTEQFRDAMTRDGIVTNAKIIADGELHRIYIDGDSKGSLNGWYVLFGDQPARGAYGCWKRHPGESIKWCEKSENNLTSEERVRYLASIQIAKEKQVRAKAEVQAKAKETAKEIWDKAKPANNNHPYLVKKKINAYGLRVSNDGKLIVPIRNTDGVLHSLQFISDKGDKRFLKGGELKEHYLSLGKLTDVIYITEGYATAATIYQATNCGVISTFNCGNLLPVAQAIHNKYPDKQLIICADNDQWSPENPGLIKAQKTAVAVNGQFVFPDFTNYATTNKPTDFNDLMILAGIDEVKRQLTNLPKQKNDDWPDPKPIRSELLPVENLPITLIPEPFREFVVDVAERMQCPIDFIAVTLIIVVASIVGTACGVRPKKEDSWLVIPNLWGCIVGRPGIMKTPAVSEVMRFLEKLQAEAKETIGNEIRKYNAELESYKAKKSAITSQMVITEKEVLNSKVKPNRLSRDELSQRLLALQEPEKPIWRRFKTNDSTIEKLSELLSENSRGLLVYRDELMGFLKTCEKTGHENDRAFFLEAWNGDGSHTTDRIGRGTTHTENLCISIFGTTQPDKLVRYLYSAIYGDNDGLVQRFQLLIYPDNPKTWELVDRKPLRKAKTDAYHLIQKLSHMDFTQHGAIKEENDRFAYFHFTKEAQQVFYEWLQDLECNKLRGDDHAILIEHLSKYRKLMPSLALLFHLIDLANNGQSNNISIENTKRACAWCEYLESHARRTYALVTDIDIQAAAILSKKIEQGKLREGFTVRDVYRLRGLLKDKDIAQAACSELLDAGWLREIVTPAAKGQKSVTTYQINPKIKVNKK